jgi:hypothetical protein
MIGISLWLSEFADVSILGKGNVSKGAPARLLFPPRHISINLPSQEDQGQPKCVGGNGRRFQNSMACTSNIIDYVGGLYGQQQLFSRRTFVVGFSNNLVWRFSGDWKPRQIGPGILFVVGVRIMQIQPRFKFFEH